MNDAAIRAAAAAIANVRGGRRGVPPIQNVLDILPPKLRDEVMEDAAAALEAACSEVDIVFDGPPGPEPANFVEAESPPGTGISFGQWCQRPDGYWVLRFRAPR